MIFVGNANAIALKPNSTK